MKQHTISGQIMAIALLMLVAFGAQATADFNHGLAVNNGQATLWLAPQADINWVDAHYDAGLGQQNVRMTYNANAQRFEVFVNASQGTQVNYSFTYAKNNLAYDSASFSATVTGGAEPGQLMPPAMSPAPGTYGAPQQVTLTSAEPGAAIHYTLDGREPSVNSPVYSMPIALNSSATLKALVAKAGLANSTVASGFYSIAGGTEFTHGVQDLGGQANLWFEAASAAWVDAHYRVNGGGQQNVRMLADAGRHGVTFAVPAEGSLSISYSFTYMTSQGAKDSASFSFERGAGTQVIAPMFTPPAGSYSSAQQVMLSTDTAGATIHYTLDGTLPTSASTQYTQALTLNASTSVRAVAVVNGVASAVSEANYQITNSTAQVATPSIVPAGGNFSGPQQVSLSVATEGASMRYTLDGTPPTAQSPLYTGPFTVSSDATVRVVGYRDGWLASSISEASFSFATGAFVKGVSQLGASATVWFKNLGAGNFVDLHYTMAQNGNSSAQLNVAMTFNDALDRWEYVIHTPADATLNYFFTYPTAIGNQDSQWFAHEVNNGCDVAAPVFNPVGGHYAESLQVTLSSDAGSVHFTTDGSAATANSPVYMGNPIAIDSAATINALTVLPDGQESCLRSESYVVGTEETAVAAPVFSIASGSYDRIQRVTLLTATTGAFIRYTTDGSAPTADSAIFTAPIELRIDDQVSPPLDTVRIRAMAVKNGLQSPITEATYTITENTKSEWNGLTTFTIANGTQGKYPDSEIYWAIIGKDWNTGQFVHVDLNGNLVPMQLSDNVVPKNGRMYTDYFHRLSEASSVTIPAINSARVLMSLGGPMYIEVNMDANGNIAYAGANIENPTDPNLDVIFDFGEFAIVPKGHPYQGIFINTTRVDHFGFPLKLEVTGLDNYRQTVGEPLTETRDELFAKFIVNTPSEFRGLAKAPYAPYRIMAPAHASFQVTPEGVVGDHAHYLDEYINSVWDKWRTEELVLTLDNGWPTFTGKVQGDSLVFSDGLGEYRVHGKPTTSMAMLGNGYLDDASGTAPGSDAYHKQLQLQAQVTAALNRHVAHLQGEHWHTAELFYPAGSTSNWYTKFWHDHAINGLTYGFSYDDIGGFSPSIYTYSPVTVTYTIGR